MQQQLDRSRAHDTDTLPTVAAMALRLHPSRTPTTPDGKIQPSRGGLILRFSSVEFKTLG
jgi:hypothetical protein